MPFASIYFNYFVYLGFYISSQCIKFDSLHVHFVSLAFWFNFGISDVTILIFKFILFLEMALFKKRKESELLSEGSDGGYSDCVNYYFDTFWGQFQWWIISEINSGYFTDQSNSYLSTRGWFHGEHVWGFEHTTLQRLQSVIYLLGWWCARVTQAVSAMLRFTLMKEKIWRNCSLSSLSWYLALYLPESVVLLGWNEVYRQLRKPKYQEWRKVTRCKLAYS